MSKSPLQSSAHGARRQARELALKLIFQKEFVDETGAEQVSMRELLARFQESSEGAVREINRETNEVTSLGKLVASEITEYGETLFNGVNSHLSEIDSLIQENSAHWKLQRMALVDLCIMRIAVLEMRFLTPALSPSVAINEAVDLAKTFGTSDSGAFVNGILDQIAKQT